MDNVVTQEVFKRIDALSEKMGVTAAYLWPKLVAWEWGQALASIITNIVIIPLVCIGSVWCFTKSERIIKEHGDDYLKNKEVFYSLMGGALALIGIIGVVAFFIGLSRNISSLISPEAAAFYKLVGK